MPEITRISMSQKEIDRYGVIKRLINKKIKGTKAAELLSLSLRQTWRLKEAVKIGGAAALVHGNRGRASNRQLPTKEREKINLLLKKHYPDFGPTLATEHLADDHKIVRHKETIRQIMIAEELWKPRKQRSSTEHRAWRQRRSNPGDLVQFDGSYHDWFEGRGELGETCLLAAIDDATSDVKDAQFSDHEGVFPVFSFWKEYLEKHGKPVSVYLDKFSTYRTQERFRKEQEDLKNQFERAMTQLRIEPISAHSPQAKGRVERLFKTFQDRLVKEMRLRKINTIDEANRFLREEFIPDFNQRFAVTPRSKEDLHRPLTQKEQINLGSIFSRHEERTIHNDFTISLNNQWFQIDPTPRVAIRPKEKVTVEEHLDGSFHLRLRGKELKYHLLPERPSRPTAARKKRPTSWVLTTSSRDTSWRPSLNHPWRQYAAAGAAKKQVKM